MHLPVAPACNIQCGFCNRKYSCVNESRPGVTARVMSPHEAIELAIRAVNAMPNISVAGIAGPGDPLANPSETLEMLELLARNLPNLHLCLSTNGLALPEYVHKLAQLGVKYLTVTVNAVDPEIGSAIYSQITTPTGRESGKESAAYLLKCQLEGIEQAVKYGMTVKINTVAIPGLNIDHIPMIAHKVASLGASLMNCIPMAAVEKTSLYNYGEPPEADLKKAREEAGKWLPQMKHCGRCRADALGLLGEKGILQDFAREKQA